MLLLIATAAATQWLFVPANPTSSDADEVYRYRVEEGADPVLEVTLSGDGVNEPLAAAAAEGGGLYVVNMNGCGSTSATLAWFTDAVGTPTYGGDEGAMSCPHGFT